VFVTPKMLENLGLMPRMAVMPSMQKIQFEAFAV
jgi:hypothetical protein